jgi:hypothetical protein
LPFSLPYKPYSFEITEVVPYVKSLFLLQGDKIDIEKQARALDIY